MSIVSVTQINKGNATVDLDAVSMQRYYIVKLSAPSATGDLEAVVASGIPVINTNVASVSGYAKVICKSKTAQLLNAETDQIHYLVEVNYDNKPETFQQSGDFSGTTKPWDASWSYSYSVNEYERAIGYDFTPTTAKALVNSAGDPFDPPITIAFVRPKVNISYATTSTFNPSTLSTYINTVNNAQVTINGQNFADGVCRLTNWQVNKAYFQDSGGSFTTYYEHEMEIEFIAGHETNFELAVLDQGYRHLVSGKLIRDVDGTGAPNPTPVLLNGSGVKVADPLTTAPTYKSFQVYKKASWSSLGLK